MRLHLTVASCLCAFALSAQTPDPDFGTDGVVTFAAPGGGEFGLHDLIHDAEGRLVVVGHLGSFFNDPAGLVLRYRPNGDLDSSFAEDGIYERAVPGYPNRYWRVALSPDGSNDILAMGHITRTPGSLETLGYSRIRPDGSPTNTWWDGTPGASMGNCWDAVGTGGAIRPDGRMVLFGKCNEGGVYNAVGVAVYDAGDTPNSSFGESNYTQLNGCCGETAVDGMIDAAGRPVLAVQMDEAYWAIRFQANGQRDYTFNGSGAYSASTRGARRIAAAPVNRLQLVGHGTGANLSEALIVRLLGGSGTPDPSFGTDGQRYYSWSTANHAFTDQAWDPQGRLVVAGTMGTFNHVGFLARLLPNGDVDSTFGVDGRYLLPHPCEGEPSISLGPNGRICVTTGFATDSAYVSCYTTDLTTTVPQTKPYHLLQAWPNPTTDALYLEGYHGSTAPQVLDPLGRHHRVPSERIGSGWRLHMDGLAAGGYVVVVPGGSVRVVVE